MEKTPFLLTVQRIIRRIQVEPDLARGLAVRLQEEIDQQPTQCLAVSSDPFVTVRAGRFRRAQLQAVERARSGQRVPPVLLAHPPFPGQIPLTHQQGESAVLAQIIVVVQVFVAQRQAIHPLGHQIPHTVFDALGVAVIGEASGQAVQQADTLIHLAQQQSATVRSDSPTVKAANHHNTSILTNTDSDHPCSGCFRRNVPGQFADEGAQTGHL